MVELLEAIIDDLIFKYSTNKFFLEAANYNFKGRELASGYDIFQKEKDIYFFEQTKLNNINFYDLVMIIRGAQWDCLGN